jgi:hypothetical protein
MDLAGLAVARRACDVGCVALRRFASFWVFSSTQFEV